MQLRKVKKNLAKNAITINLNPDCSVSGPLVNEDGEESFLKCKRADLIASSGEESSMANAPRLVKVIAKDIEGNFPVEEGWKLVEDKIMQLYEYDQDFLDKFLDNSEMVQHFNAGNLAFVEGRNIFHVNLIIQH